MIFKPAVSYNGKNFPAVSLDGLRDEMWDVLPIVERAYIHQGFEAVCSCGTEKFYTSDLDNFNHLIHSIGSLHYRGLALDFSTNGISMESIMMIRTEIQDGCDRLRAGYQLIYETSKTHFHLEYDNR